MRCAVHCVCRLQVCEGVEVTAYYAGHVLGAVMLHVRVGSESVVYTGELLVLTAAALRVCTTSCWCHICAVALCCCKRHLAHASGPTLQASGPGRSSLSSCSSIVCSLLHLYALGIHMHPCNRILTCWSSDSCHEACFCVGPR